MFFWSEWISVAGLSTNGVLPTTSAADFFLGDYLVTGGVFINPAKTLTDPGAAWIQSAISFTHNDFDPQTRTPGSIGDAAYYSRAEGPFKETQALKMDVGYL